MFNTKDREVSVCVIKNALPRVAVSAVAASFFQENIQYLYVVATALTVDQRGGVGGGG